MEELGNRIVGGLYEIYSSPLRSFFTGSFILSSYFIHDVVVRFGLNQPWNTTNKTISAVNSVLFGLTIGSNIDDFVKHMNDVIHQSN